MLTATRSMDDLRKELTRLRREALAIDMGDEYRPRLADTKTQEIKHIMDEMRAQGWEPYYPKSLHELGISATDDLIGETVVVFRTYGEPHEITITGVSNGRVVAPGLGRDIAYPLTNVTTVAEWAKADR